MYHSSKYANVNGFKIFNFKHLPFTKITKLSWFSGILLKVYISNVYTKSSLNLHIEQQTENKEFLDLCLYILALNIAGQLFITL